MKENGDAFFGFYVDKLQLKARQCQGLRFYFIFWICELEQLRMDLHFLYSAIFALGEFYGT